MADKDEEHDDEGVDRGSLSSLLISLVSLVSIISLSLFNTDLIEWSGESLAVDKHVGDVLFFTTGCKRGECYMLVTETAKSTFVGKTA